MKNLKFALFSVLFILSLSGCATFVGTIPLEAEGKDLYLSPINHDGIMDTISVPMNIPETKGLIIQGYTIEIRSPLDEIVFSQAWKDEPKGLFKRKNPAVLPGEVLWDGTGPSGEWTPDGDYLLTVEVFDYKGNKGFFGPVKIIVDNTAPYAELYFPYSVFSPNGDGSQDFLDIYQKESSFETLWEGAITNNTTHETVRSYEWTGIAGNLVWNGRTSDNLESPEGTYSYALKSTDEAGNGFQLSFDDIVIDNTSYPVNMNLVGSPYFSPNDDGVRDTVNFQVDAAEPSRIQSLILGIINSSGTLIKELQGDSSGIYVFDGKRSGKVLPEGVYYASLTVQYINGDLQKLVSEKITLDVKAPGAVIKVSLPVFSPNGDGRKDSVEIFQSSSIETLWTGQIVLDKKVVRSWTWRERVLPFFWDGRDDTGTVVSDGLYQYRLSSTDEAGNSVTSLSSLFSVDTRATPVRLIQSAEVFSPNGDGDSDAVMFYPQPLVKEGISSWVFSVLNETDMKVFKIDGLETLLPETISWDGRDKAGNIREGQFRGVVEVEYMNGNYETSTALPSLRIDLTPPVIDVTTSNLPFSPDNDGDSDVLVITIDPQDPSGIKSWAAKILDPTGSLFLALDPPSFINGTLTWNGRDKKGELVQSASDYILEVSAVDGVGNKGSLSKTIPIDILVIRDGDRLLISISSIYFKPFTADYISIDPVLKNRNLKTLDRLSEILKKYYQYRIQLEGHAVRLLWSDDKKWKTEEDEVLMPLSRDRAETIKSALIQRGIRAERMISMGYGGYRPVVPHSDEQNRWKNRRVEFILIK